MQNLRKKFPVLQQCIYANTAATGLLSEDLMEWRQGHDLDYLIGGSEVKMKNFEKIPDIRSTVGDFFHCHPDDVALVPNFSMGLNIILEGLPKNQKALLLKEDYPSLNWPFESRNFKREYVEIDHRLEERIYDKVAGGAIDVLALSVVQWVNGIKIDLEFLKKLKKDFPNLMLIADGTQFCGTEPFNFGNSGIDILGSSGYKWLLAGFGNGFFLVKDEVKNRFDLKFTGYGSVAGDLSKRENIPFCRHLEPGHLASLNFGSLSFGLDFLNEIGVKHIQAQLSRLSKKSIEQFSALGLLEEAVVQRKQHSTIFNVSGDKALFHQLRDKEVVCSLRGKGIRLSFHFYNTEDEIETIAKILKANSAKL
ncbi:aminotransferase class V-fold PLP-dependent enzyme [Muricauda sp. JGD-17]|uniref:Aminotransferase class V-fold PLP-dependent enzyme n=1 Tax=Flagellimonas ochracea TaxID=2696472 RepID=A0A964WXY8_9FLAO|nr:aminotransferase class V-fold PLP-dependent enzyme [Allomuricauda ochracea]NAY92288.1 aminotransferase class V-fold PLP-dependent enzyme [Allomuricauda ochracea]